MPFERFPLVFWRMSDSAVLGTVLGTDIAVVEADVKKVKKHAADAIVRFIRDGYFIEAPDMKDPQMHFHRVDVQLSYRQDSGTYPLSSATPFRVAAVYGNAEEEGYGECHLPHFGEEFYYYSSEQRGTLIKHFTREFLQNMSPERASRYILPSDPWLETVRVNTEIKEQRWLPPDTATKALLEIADPLPVSKKIRRNVTRLPDAAWERAEDVNTLVKILRESSENCVLVGAQGVGKSTLWNEAIKTVSRSFSGEHSLTFWRTSCQRLVGKAKYLGEWQAICDEIVAALSKVNGVLWITDFMTMLRSGGEVAEDSIAAYLQNYVSRGQLRIIAELRPQELDSARALLPGFVHLFKQIPVSELSDSQTRQVLNQFAQYAHNNYTLNTDDAALNTCFQLANRYLKYEKRPGNVVRFFSECVRAWMRAPESRFDREFVTAQFVAYTGLPEILLRDDQVLSQDDLARFFGKRIIGQDHVISELCSIIHLYKAGLNDPERPIATLLLAGPTGVGKTAVTKALAEFFFSAGQKKDPLIAVDMSEFQHPGQISRLIGDSETPGKLVSHIRNQPFSVVLFDEIEKAHPSVFDMLLTVLDEGILTDRHGRSSDFRSSIIVMTSNLGAAARNSPGFVATDSGDNTIAAVRQHFRPEFFNRIDLVLQFNALDMHSVRAIVVRELDLLHQRDRIRQGAIQLEFGDKLVDFIAEVGFSPEYGARPIQRAIEKYVVGAMAKYLLQAQSVSRVYLDLDNVGNVVVKNQNLPQA